MFLLVDLDRLKFNWSPIICPASIGCSVRVPGAGEGPSPPISAWVDSVTMGASIFAFFPAFLLKLATFFASFSAFFCSLAASFGVKLEVGIGASGGCGFVARGTNSGASAFSLDP